MAENVHDTCGSSGKSAWKWNGLEAIYREKERGRE